MESRKENKGMQFLPMVLRQNLQNLFGDNGYQDHLYKLYAQIKGFHNTKLLTANNRVARYLFLADIYPIMYGIMLSLL